MHEKITNKNYILLIRFSAMGDVAILSTLLENVFSQKENHDFKFIVLTKPQNAKIFIETDKLKVLSADFKKDYKGVIGLFRLYKHLRVYKFSAVLDLHNVLRTRILRLFFKLFSPSLPFYILDKGRAEKRTLTRYKNKELKQLPTSYERYARLFKKIGCIVDFTRNYYRTKGDLSPKVLEFLREGGVDRFIVIAPFASFAIKEYPLELVEKLIACVVSRLKLHIFLIGGPGAEASALEDLASKCDCTQNIAGKFSFSEELQLLSRASVVVSADSGNGHLSAMYGVPVISLWGVTHPYLGFYPYGQPLERAVVADRNKYPLIPTSVYGNKFPKEYADIMSSISLEAIYKKIEEIITTSS